MIPDELLASAGSRGVLAKVAKRVEDAKIASRLVGSCVRVARYEEAIGECVTRIVRAFEESSYALESAPAEALEATIAMCEKRLGEAPPEAAIDSLLGLPEESARLRGATLESVRDSAAAAAVACREEARGLEAEAEADIDGWRAALRDARAAAEAAGAAARAGIVEPEAECDLEVELAAVRRERALRAREELRRVRGSQVTKLRRRDRLADTAEALDDAVALCEGLGVDVARLVAKLETALVEARCRARSEREASKAAAAAVVASAKARDAELVEEVVAAETRLLTVVETRRQRGGCARKKKGGIVGAQADLDTKRASLRAHRDNTDRCLGILKTKAAPQPQPQPPPSS